MDAQYRHMITERPGIGATGHITQATRLNFTSLTTTLPMVIIVRRGRKVIQSPNYGFELEPGEAIAIAQGQVFDFENIPAPDGDYEARWLQSIRRRSPPSESLRAHGRSPLRGSLDA
jgi:hypothetical protein